MLEESQNRRQMAERLRNQDLEAYGKYLQGEVEWLRREGSQRLAEASAAPDPRKRAIALERVTLAGLMDMLGDAGRARLLAGSPYAVQVGQLPPALRGQYREYLMNRSAHLRGTPADELDRYSLVLLLARTPTDPNGAQLVESLVRPDGFCWARGSLLSMPAKQPLPFLGPRFALPPLRKQDALDQSRRVSLMLTPAPGAKPGVDVPRNLDQVLETVARQCELNVIADGYLRPPCRFPANLRVADYPLTKLLDALTRTWGCDWRFLDAEKKTILVRARGWWLEDAADVPQPLVNEFRERLGADRSPALPDVLRLAELSKAQIHKLIECRICPAGTGLVKPGWYDDAGVRPCLQFFNRLPGPLQARAQSPEGLPLQEVPRELVDTWLQTTLVAEAGAVKPEFQKDLVFSLRPGARDPTAPAGFEVAIRRSQPGRTLWIGYIQPPSRLADAPKDSSQNKRSKSGRCSCSR
jgi:hypothetical protein